MKYCVKDFKEHGLSNVVSLGIDKGKSHRETIGRRKKVESILSLTPLIMGKISAVLFRVGSSQVG